MALRDDIAQLIADAHKDHIVTEDYWAADEIIAKYRIAPTGRCRAWTHQRRIGSARTTRHGSTNRRDHTMSIKDELMDIIFDYSDEFESSELTADAILARYGVVNLVDLGETRVWTHGAGIEIDDQQAFVSIDVPNWVVAGRSMIELSTPVALREIAAVLITAANRAEENLS